jgi:hypothetical protein
VTEGETPYGLLFQYGVLGVVFGLMLFAGVAGHLWWGRSVAALVDSFREQIANLKESILDLRKQRDDALRIGAESASALRELTAAVQALMKLTQQYEAEARQRRRV